MRRTSSSALYRGWNRWLSHLARTSAVTTGVLSSGWGTTIAAATPTSIPSSCSTLNQSLGSSAFSTTTTSVRGHAATPLEERMTQHAVDIVQHSIQAVDPYQAVKSHFRIRRSPSDDSSASILEVGGQEINLQNYDEIVLVAFGKASSAMAAAVLEQLYYDVSFDASLLPPSTGVVICKDDHATPDELTLLEKHGIQVQMASHPVPDARSAQAATQLLEAVQAKANPKTLVLCAISGGGSALFCKPLPPLTLEDLQQVNSILLGAGMGIQDMNVIRKRLEEGKGGRLAATAYPSQVVTLVLSDVLGDPLDLIASGPTVPDTSSWKDAWAIVQEFQLEDKLPAKALDLLQKGIAGEVPDAPSENHPVFETAQTVLVGNNALAVQAAAERAQALGYHPVVLGTQLEGEAKEMAHMYVGMARHLQETSHASSTTSPLRAYGPVPPATSLPIALIAGGETTVSLPTDGSNGKGGRNQELALAAASLLEKAQLRNIVVASVGTDGTDGPTDAAGAVVDGSTLLDGTRLDQARQALKTHNAYPFLKALTPSHPDVPPALIVTGPTGTNVADVCVTLIGEPQST